MSALTPAQIAVLERIKKKKELQQRKATKRKAKAEPEPDSTIHQDEVTADVNEDQKSAKKRKRLDPKYVENTVAEAPKTPKKETKKGAVAGTVENKPAPPTAAASTRRGRKSEKFENEETSDAPSDQHLTEQAAGPPTKIVARRRRKTEKFGDPEKSLANETLNQAQLEVLGMLKTKEASKEKGRKSLKSSDLVGSKAVQAVEIDSGSEKAVTSTIQEVRIGRKSLKKEDASTSARIKSVGSKRRKQSVAVASVELSNEEGQAQLPDEPLPEDSTEDEGPLNATMLAVMDKIKEKKARKSVETPAAKSLPKARAEKSRGKLEKQEAPLTPNQVSVMKKLQEKKLKQQFIPVVDSADDDDDDSVEDQSTEDQIKQVINRLSVPLNKRERTLVTRLVNAGVYAAVDEGRALSSQQEALVLKCKAQLEAGASRMAGAPLKHVASYSATEDETETDVAEEIVAITSKQRNVTAAAFSEDESDVEAVEHRPAKTYLIFDTNAYLRILPYCRAVLDSDRLKGETDYEELIMFALFVVIRELDVISKKKLHLRPPAMAAIRLIHGALQDKNLHIEGQDFASSKEKLADSTLNDDYILNSADLLRNRGETVLVVTDDRNLQVKIAMMRIKSLNCLEFISRFHWLTRVITNDIKREAVTIGEDVLARFIECVVASIVLKGVLAHLAPMPMKRRRELFPSEKLAIVLALMLKNKSVLQTHNGPFSIMNYDRVAQTLNPLQMFDEGNRPGHKDERRFQHFARFLFSAEILCRNIATYFPNMESRAELVGVVASYFRMHLPESERSSLPKVDSTRRFAEQAPTSHAEPTRKALLPARRAAYGSTLPRSSVGVSEQTEGTSDDYFCSVKNTQSARSTRSSQEEAPHEDANFAFFPGRRLPEAFRPVSAAEPSKSFIPTPTKVVAQKAHAAGPYQALQQSISGELMAIVYEYFQKFGLSICNYTGSCCVKMGVKFSLAFKVSSARVDNWLPEVTDSFAMVLRAMKNMISGTQADKFAREFLQHSLELMNTLGRADPELVACLPKVTHEALLAFSKDPEGKQQLVTGYQQFCDFNNCLQKCWLEAQRA